MHLAKHPGWGDHENHDIKSTKFPRAATARSPYSELVMRGAFVVQLRKVREGSSQFEGVVEEVDTGTQAKFLSESELIEFLRERFGPDTAKRKTQEGNE